MKPIRSRLSEFDLYAVKRRFLITEYRLGRLNEPALRQHLIRLGALSPDVEITWPKLPSARGSLVQKHAG